MNEKFKKNELISKEIREINERVEEVCPSVAPNIPICSSALEGSSIRKKISDTTQSYIKELEYKNNVAIEVFTYATGLIIYDPLRKEIERALKILKN